MIYYVEDESNIRDLVVYTLKASGFEAQGFEDGVEFWTAMKAQKPELIILDVMLPGEDGLTILKRLRSSPVTADIPVKSAFSICPKRKKSVSKEKLNDRPNRI